MQSGSWLKWEHLCPRKRIISNILAKSRTRQSTFVDMPIEMRFMNMRKAIARESFFAIGLLAVLAIDAGFGTNRIGMASQSKDQTVENRLRQLEDREAIRQLLMNYGRFLDQRDFSAFSQLFAENGGEWIGGMGSAKGPQAIQKLMEDTIGKSTGGSKLPNLHLFTNEIIDVDGDRATAVTKWIFVVLGDSNHPQLVYIGHYDDSLQREKGRWKFLRRAVYTDIPSENPLEQD